MLVHGSRASSNDSREPYDASWERNRKLILEAESLGFDCTLVAQHTVNPSDDERGQLEAWTASAAMAGLTSKIEIIAAIKPMLFNPVVLAKMALQIEEISNGRFAINLVNAWNKAEIEQAGIVFHPHDERYAYGTEWIEIVEALLRGERVSYQGQYWHIDNYKLSPARLFRDRPTIYVGGESEPARQLVAQKGDVWFLNGQPINEIRKLIADMQARDRQGSPPLQFGLSAFVIARETEAEAIEEHQRLLALSRADSEYLASSRRNTDDQVVMTKTAEKYEVVGTNGGTAAGLVGSYDQVAERIIAFHAAGIDTLLMQYQPFEAEMRRFVEHVIPKLRSIR